MAGDGNAKRAAFRAGLLEREPSADGLYAAPGQRQAESGAHHFAPIDAVEAVEDVLARVGWYARSAVDDVHDGQRRRLPGD